VGETTKIAWATHTFNPWIGCTKVGPGCDHCYAETLDKNRFSKTLGGGTAAVPIVHWGPGAPRHRTSASNWNQPLKWNREAAKDGEPHRVFCASLADVFDNEVDHETRSDLFELMEVTPNLIWLPLTKRIGRWMECVPPWWLELFPDNVHLGITVVTQEEADRDIPKLLEIPARVHWLSVEPQLEQITLTRIGAPPDYPELSWNVLHPKQERLIDWVITGGESGGDEARPYDLDWARSLRNECRAAGVPIFVKQTGRHPFCERERWSTRGGGIAVTVGTEWEFREPPRDRAGADPAEWPEDLRVREFPK
jgi:protein gp37